MKRHKHRLFTVLPYLGLLFASIFSIWTFLRSEQYRRSIEEILGQTYEIQWRISQIRERLLQVDSDIRLASVSGKLDPDIHRQIILLRVNIRQLLGLAYVDRFLPPSDLTLLAHISQIIAQKIAAIGTAQTNYQNVLGRMARLEQEIFEISSAATNHSSDLQDTAKIDAAASRNGFLFTMVLVLATFFYLVIHQRHVFIRRRDKHLRSFASLFAHMTQSRVTALRLFLAGKRLGCSGDEAWEAACRTADELEAINDGLLSAAYPSRDLRATPLTCILRRMVKDQPDVTLDIDPRTLPLPVPETHCQVLLDELVQNARAAVMGHTHPLIIIRARIKRRYFVGRPDVLLEVEDNGAGMSPDIMAKALTPFFSTKAGKHLGLGLTSCAEMVSIFRGKLRIESKPGHGTIVQVRLPVLVPGRRIKTRAL